MLWDCMGIGRRARGLGVGLAVLLTLAACGLGTTPVDREPSSSPTAMPPSNAKDAAFAAHVRAEGWAPNVPPNEDGALATDAQSFCDELASQTGDVTSIRNNLQNAAADGSAAQAITKSQAQALLTFSAQTYCPSKVAMVERAFT